MKQLFSITKKLFSITKKIKMKKLCVISGKHRKFKKPEISNIFEKTLVLSIISSKCKNEDEKLFKEEESTEILKILDLFKSI